MIKNILSLIQQGESQIVEFKTSFQKEVIGSVVSFANAKGGTIFIGIKDDGHIVGVDIDSETLKDWINQIKLNTQPQMLVDIESISVEEKTVAGIDVKEYPMKPIAYKNRYYKMVQNSNHLMDLDEISNMHLQTINSSGDYYIDERHDFSDISQENIDNFIQKVEKNLDKKFSDDPLTILKKYELIKDDKLTFGAYLLFTSNNSAITAFQIGRFKDPVTIIDNIDINTNLFKQVDTAIEFIRKHLMTEFIITGEPQRTVKYDYPLEAIREIVINMVVHRDYRDSGHSIIKIFDDRIEFFNPGKLYGGLSVEQLLGGDYSSQTRNRAVARAFKEAGIIEQYGSGIAKIQKECKKHGDVTAKFEEFQHGFRITIIKNSNVGVNEVYDFIAKNQPVKVNKIATYFNTVTQRTIERWIKQLKDENKIEFKGASKTGGYVMKDSDDK